MLNFLYYYGTILVATVYGVNLLTNLIKFSTNFYNKANKNILLKKFNSNENEIIIINHFKNGKTNYLFNADDGELNSDESYKFKQKLINTTKQNIVLILNTPGGHFIALKEIIDSIIIFKDQNPNSKIIIYVPFRAYSCGTFLTLLADELYMSPYAHLSPIDPQIILGYRYYDKGINDVVDIKGYTAKDSTLIAQNYVKRNLDLANKLYDKCVNSSSIFKNLNHDIIKEKLLTGKNVIHHNIISTNELKEIGIEVNYMDKDTQQDLTKLLKY